MNASPAKKNYKEQYRQLLSPYAFNFVSAQLSAIAYVKIKNDFGDVIETASRNASKFASYAHCMCVESRSMLLPCRHILKFREQKHKPLFDEKICDKQWTQKYYKQNQRLLSTIQLEDSDESDFDVEMQESDVSF